MDRARRLLGENFELVPNLRAAIDSVNPGIRILAASIKSPAQAIDTMREGAHGITVPIAIVEALAHHDLSESATEEFSAAFPRESGCRFARITNL